MKTLIITIAAALLASPAVARSEADPTPAVSAPRTADGAATKARKTRYCVVAEITGSRIARKTCLTRDAWLLQGYDPLENLRK